MMHYKLLSVPQCFRGRLYLSICVFAVSLSLYLCSGACRIGRETDASRQPSFGELRLPVELSRLVSVHHSEVVFYRTCIIDTLLIDLFGGGGGRHLHRWLVDESFLL